MNISRNNGNAVVKGRAVTIRVAFASLPAVIEGAWAARGIDKRLKITDLAKFADELVRELNREQEDGTTPIHRLFDRAIWAAFEGGAEGIEEHEEQDA